MALTLMEGQRDFTENFARIDDLCCYNCKSTGFCCSICASCDIIKNRSGILFRSRECKLDLKTIDATVEIGQLDGSVKKVVDEDLKQQIGMKLLEEIPKFPLEEAKKQFAEE